MTPDKRVLCLQAEITDVSKTFGSGKVELTLSLGSPQDLYEGEATVRVPSRDRTLFKVGSRYSIVFIPHPAKAK